MMKHRLKPIALGLAVSCGTLLGSSVVQADQIDQIIQVGKSKTVAAHKSQQRIDELASDTRDLLQDWKAVMKQIDSLKVYNARLQRQIENQLARLQRIERSIEDVATLQREIPDLVISMVDALERFVELDVPFLREERLERINRIRSNLDRSDISIAEAFRQVLEAYKIESEYGRKIETYTGSVEIDGVERDVNMFRVGRISLMYQTADKEVTGAWDKKSRRWVELDPGEYRSAVSQGIRIAKKQASIDILDVPVVAPEAAE